MNEYELMTVFHPRLGADETTAAVTGVEQAIVAQGGELLSTDAWGRRRLAYPIKGVNDGTYVLMTFKMPATGTAPLERGLRISEAVLRHLLIRGIIPFDAGRDDRDRDVRDDRDDRDDRDRDDRDSDDFEDGDAPAYESADEPVAAAVGGDQADEDDSAQD